MSGTNDLSGIARDPQAFEVFYRRHVTAVTRFLARRVADPQVVADLTAEVFLAVIDSAGTYRPGRGTELGWLYGICRNTIAGERRRAALKLRAEAMIAGRRLLGEDDIARLEERIDAESAARGLHAALSQLPENGRPRHRQRTRPKLPASDLPQLRPGNAPVGRRASWRATDLA